MKRGCCSSLASAEAARQRPEMMRAVTAAGSTAAPITTAWLVVAAAGEDNASTACLKYRGASNPAAFELLCYYDEGKE